MKFTTAGSPGHSPTARPPRLVEPEVVREVCGELGLAYRKRILDPLTTLHVLLVQALHGNTALHDLRLKSGVEASVGAICRARARLPLAFFQGVLARLGRRWQDATADVGTWMGHRVVFVDGSGCSMPEAGPTRRHYGGPAGQAPGCGFPVARLLGNPDRPDRAEPRVRKRRPKAYPLMTKPRAELKKSLLGQEVAA